MRDSSFLLLDANVVIQLFRCGAWRALTERSTVYVSRTVVEQEAHFYEDEDGKRVDFDLRQDEAAGSIQVVDATLAQTSPFSRSSTRSTRRSSILGSSNPWRI